MKFADKFLKRWHLVVAIIAALGYLGLDATGLRPTWFFEHSALASEFYADKCERLQNEWYIAKDLAEGYVRRGEPVPAWLFQKIVKLERDMGKAGC